jgi:hypothetical protein
VPIYDFIAADADADPHDRAALPAPGRRSAGYPNPYWIDGSTNFGTPLCTVARCAADPTAAVAGSGSICHEYGYLNQTVTILPSPRS